MAIVNVLITYDISSKHGEIKKEMLGKGYRDTVLDSKKQTVYLPNTSLVIAKEGMTVSKAVDDLQAAVNTVNNKPQTNPKVKFERAFAVEYTTWSGIYGEPHQ